MEKRVHGLTVASQQTRTSYRWPGFRFSRKNHDFVPSGESVVGNEALSLVRTTGLCGDNLSSPRSSRAGCSEGIVAGAGARNMVFSTFACTTSEKSGRRSPRVGSSFVCILIGDSSFCCMCRLG